MRGKILVVEDNVMMASGLRAVLGLLGLRQTTMTADGGEVLRLLKTERFDLLIVDWMLPSLSGTALVEWMRDNQDYRDTPVIMVTARDGAEDARIAAEAGVNAHVLRFVDKDVLRETIGNIMASRRRTAAA